MAHAVLQSPNLDHVKCFGVRSPKIATGAMFSCVSGGAILSDGLTSPGNLATSRASVCGLVP